MITDKSSTHADIEQDATPSKPSPNVIQPNAEATPSAPHNTLADIYAPAPRPARSVREIRRRQKQTVQGEHYHSTFDRIFYATLTGLMYGSIGLLLDWVIAIIRASLDVGNGDVFWLFTPFMVVLGAVIGFIDGKFASGDTMDAFKSEPDPKYDDLSIRYDIFRGLGVGIGVFAVMWLVMLLLG